MVHRTAFGRSALAVAVLGLAGTGSAQVFTQNTTDIPTTAPDNASYSENVDFGDLDLDGDWDAVFADGGDFGNDQNRIWINQGGLQGGSTGVFVDETVVRAPAVSDMSRDVELADVDGDGDLDAYIANDSNLINQTSRWWINQGGEQGGANGFFVDETATRWVGVGGPGSSVPVSAVLAAGGFIDWVGDGDFGDLDADGDLDLLHGSYGPVFSGVVPTRIFLNDGDGFFEEFNPSGIQLAAFSIPNGTPALWAQGVQFSGTTNATGTQADIATANVDLEIVDSDGDGDLDILLGELHGLPRMFHNGLVETGTLSFRDVSHLVFPPDWATGTGAYDQEFADVDGDSDVDLYGLNWAGFSDRMFRNQGGGIYGDETTISGTTADAEESDFIDFDNDGDLDVYLANFSGVDTLIENNDTGSGPLGFDVVPTVLTGLGTSGTLAHDADVCDVDGDGDYDVFTARSATGPGSNEYFENVTQAADTTAPSLSGLEDLEDADASPEVRAVRVAVFDNAPYYVTFHNDTVLEVTVDGCRLPDVSMASSGGQLFRGELPGNLLGSVSYAARSSDEYQNSATSAPAAYASTTALPVGGAFGTGTVSASTGVEPGLSALSVAFPGTTLYVATTDLPPGGAWILALNSAASPPIPIPGLVVLNVGGVNYATLPGSADAVGCAVVPLPLSAAIPSGASLFFQAFSLDAATNGDLLSSSAGLEVVTQ